MTRRKMVLGALALGACILGQTLQQRRARASVFEALLGFGDAMAPYLDDRRSTEAPRQVLLNGQRLWVAVGHTRHLPAQVADWYSDRYRKSGAALAAIAHDIKGAPAAPPTQLKFGDDNDGGMVAFDLGAPSAAALVHRFDTFARTRRLGELGQIRFLRWTRDPDGGTRFLTMWTDARLSLDGLLPPRGTDAPGGDLPDVVRPAGMSRVLALEEVGKPYHTRVYEGMGSVSGVAAEMALGMEQRGWRSDDTFAHGTSADGGVQLRFDRDARTAIVAIDEGQRGLVDVAIVESGR